MWEGVGDRTELQHIDPHSIGHNNVSFPFPWAAQPGAWGPSLSGCWFSLPHFIPNSSDLPTDWISCALSYIIVQRPPSCGRHNFTLIQPVRGQGYNILIFLDRMHLLFTQVHFLFWRPGPGRRAICNRKKSHSWTFLLWKHTSRSYIRN